MRWWDILTVALLAITGILVASDDLTQGLLWGNVAILYARVAWGER